MITQIFNKLYLRLLLVVLFLIIGFLVTGGSQKSYAILACLQFHSTGDPALDGKCITTPHCSTCSDNTSKSLGVSCTKDADCICEAGAYAICMKPAKSVTEVSECQGEPACLAALAAVNQLILGGTGAYVQISEDGNSFIVLCTNGGLTSLKFYPTPKPTATPTPVPQCGSTCTKNADCAGATGAQGACPVCSGGTCQPAPTPTPAFNPNSCTCDGIDYSSLAAGPVTITSFAKVTGADIPKAQVVSEKFFLTQGTETTGAIIASSDHIASSIASQDANKVRYQSQWSFTMPQLTTGATYRIWSQISCQPKAAVYNYQQPSNVLGVSAQKDTSLFGRIASFFAGLLGVKSPLNIATSIVPSATPVFVASSPTGSSILGTDTARNTVQLGALNPYDVQQKTCDFIIFKNNF